MKNKNTYDEFVEMINNLPEKTRSFVINIAYTCTGFTGNPYLYLWKHYQQFPKATFITEMQAMFGE
jgi:hypothetical protein